MVNLTKKYLIRQGFWIYLFTFLAAPLGYLIRILYARTFSVEEFGLIYSIIGFIALISIFNDLGFSETLNYYATRFYEKKQYAKVKGSFIFALLMQGGTAILLGILFWFLSPWLAEHYFRSPLALNVFRAFIMYFFFYNVSMSLIQLLHATHNYLISPLSEFLRQFIILFLSFALFYFDILSSKNIGLIWGISYLFLVIIYFILYYKILTNIAKVKTVLSFDLFKKLWSYAIFAIWTTGASIILSRIDVFMITFLLNVEAVGYYTIAFSLASLISILFSPVMSIFFPMSSKLSLTNKGSEKLNHIIRTMYSLGLYIILPVVVVLAMFPSEVINLMFGVKFISSKNTLIILSFGILFGVFNGFNVSIMSGLKMLKEKTYLMFSGIIINTILNFLLIPYLNIEGAAFATLITFFAMMIYSYYLISKRIKVNLNLRLMFKVFLCNVVIILIIYSLKIILNLNMYIEAIIIGLIVMIVYVIIGRFIKIINFKGIYKDYIKKQR
jgi:O-antigen/teichoic acid export membrane protein